LLAFSHAFNDILVAYKKNKNKISSMIKRAKLTTQQLFEISGRISFYILVGDQRPGEANEAGVSIGIPNELSPNHNQNESGHNAGRRHRRCLGFTLSTTLWVELRRGAGAELGKHWAFTVDPICGWPVSKAELIPTKLIII
jgi:hypothetical protein